VEPVERDNLGTVLITSCSASDGGRRRLAHHTSRVLGRTNAYSRRSCGTMQVYIVDEVDKSQNRHSHRPSSATRSRVHYAVVLFPISTPKNRLRYAFSLRQKSDPLQRLCNLSLVSI
jgi:hypothetical protein